jgi:dephospho-CoA kinase
MKKIGITGGIGSGKSIVCEVFRTLGVSVYNADIHAKILLDEDTNLQDKVRQTFGQDIFSMGKLNRKALADKVFNNPSELNKLNKIIHPAVSSDFEKWVFLHQAESYILKEAAIIFESGTYKQLDAVILVYAPIEIRIERVMLRDHINKNKVIERIQNQMSDEEKKKLSDFMIYNDENHSIIHQVLSLHQQFILE